MGSVPAAAEWETVRLGSRLRFYQAGGDKFKTCALRVCLHMPLEASTVTATALVPHLLGRGCRGYPDLTAIGRRLEELYGAGVGAGVLKIGEVQTLFLGLDVVDERYLPEGAQVLGGAVDLLSRMCLEPALDAAGVFPAAVVVQEKENLAHRILGILNDKASYAAMRCVEEMCRGEPYALPAQGRLEDLESLEASALTQRWRDVLASASVDVFAVGGGPGLADGVARALESLTQGTGQSVRSRPGEAPPQPRVVQERERVQQGKLCIGYRTAITRRDPQHPAMRMYSGILGGFPHSKLFRNVREKASLAYSASSDWDGHKGILMIHAGIEPAAYAQAVEIIGRQVEDMAAGRIDDDELEFTRRGLMNHIRASADSTYGLLNTALGQALVDDVRTVPERLAEIAGVRREDVVAAAQGVRLDTIYFLSSEEGGDAGAEPLA